MLLKKRFLLLPVMKTVVLRNIFVEIVTPPAFILNWIENLRVLTVTSDQFNAFLLNKSIN